MIVSFNDEGTRDIFESQDTRGARKTCPPSLWEAARRRLEVLDRAQVLGDLALVHGNRLERLKGNRAGQHSIRINRQFRICFWWTTQGPEFVEIVDYHSFGHDRWNSSSLRSGCRQTARPFIRARCCEPSFWSP